MEWDKDGNGSSSCHLPSLLTPPHQNMLYIPAVRPARGPYLTLIVKPRLKLWLSSLSFYLRPNSSLSREGGGGGCKKSQKQWLEVIKHQEISLSVNVEDIKNTQVVSGRTPLYKHSEGTDAHTSLVLLDNVYVCTCFPSSKLLHSSTPTT